LGKFCIYHACEHILLSLRLAISPITFSQKNQDPFEQGDLFFPYPPEGRKWHSSIGITLTNMPEDINEEVQIRFPAIKAFR